MSRRPVQGTQHLEVGRRDCGPCRKVLYRDRARAKASMQRLKRIERSEGKRPGHLTIYRCPAGEGYHVGHDRRRTVEG